MPSLFSGKIGAVLTRNWKKRTKGRDIFDYDFYLTNKIKINQNYVRHLLISSSLIKEDEFNQKILKNLIVNKLNELDYERVIFDIRGFLENPEDIKKINKDLLVEKTLNYNFF